MFFLIKWYVDWKGLEARTNPQQTTASCLACAMHGVIFTVQLVVTSVVVRSKEDVIDTYAGEGAAFDIVQCV